MTTKNNGISAVEPYLSFGGRCEEALEFYKNALGAEIIALMRFKESPDKQMCAAGSDEKVMHACFKVGGTTLMASDGQCAGQSGFSGFSLSLSVSNEAEADRLFAALSKGGEVQMPLMKTFFSPKFGMVADRFGVSWMVIIPVPCGAISA